MLTLSQRDRFSFVISGTSLSSSPRRFFLPSSAAALIVRWIYSNILMFDIFMVFTDRYLHNFTITAIHSHGDEAAESEERRMEEEEEAEGEMALQILNNKIFMCLYIFAFWFGSHRCSERRKRRPRTRCVSPRANFVPARLVVAHTHLTASRRGERTYADTAQK